jgi:hypothetical protein
MAIVDVTRADAMSVSVRFRVTFRNIPANPHVIPGMSAPAAPPLLERFAPK